MQGPFNVEEGIKAVHEAYERGINYFDTSPYYGNLQSEKAGACVLQNKLMRSCYCFKDAFASQGFRRCSLRQNFLQSGARNGSEESAT